MHWHCIFPSLLALSRWSPVFRNSSSLVSQLGSFPVLPSFLQYWSQVNHRYESNHLIYQCLPDHWQIVQICLMCSHSYSRCLVVSVSPHLGHSSVTVILYFFILACVKKSLWISLKYMFLSLGFLQLLQNFVMLFLSKFTMLNSELKSRTSIFFSVFFNVTCNSLTVDS